MDIPSFNIEEDHVFHATIDNPNITNAQKRSIKWMGQDGHGNQYEIEGKTFIDDNKPAITVRFTAEQAGQTHTIIPYIDTPDITVGTKVHVANGKSTHLSYLIDRKGMITTLCGDVPIDPNGVDYLFNEEGQSIMIKDQNLLPQLVKVTNMGERKRKLKMHRFLTTRSFIPARDIFTFAADNCDVEWGFYGHKNGTYYVGCFSIDEYSPNPYKEDTAQGWKIQDIEFGIHSHPNTEYPDPKGDWGIGDLGSTWMVKKIQGKVIPSSNYKGDMATIWRRHELVEKKGFQLYRHFHYFPSGGVYEYTNFSSRIFISKVIHQNLVS